jgi:hypothetical protein
MRKLSVCTFACIAATLTFGTSPTSAAPTEITTYPAGTLPEDIVPVPSGFGTTSGYFVDNPTQNFSGSGQILNVPSGGGAPVPFKTFTPPTQTLQPLGGAFLPSNYGTLAGQFLAAGRTAGASTVTSQGAAISSTGAVTAIPSLTNVGGNSWAGVAIAPSGFGTFGGTAFLANEGPNSGPGPGGIYTLNPTNLAAPLFATITGGQPFGLAFAPAGFGGVAGNLLVSDSVSGKIWSVSPTGTVTLFATVPLRAGQFGDRQMAFAPAGFGAYGGDLLVSVSGSNAGGGVAGTVDVLNSSGATIAFLATGVAGAPFDPRGLFFPDATDVWVNNADPGIFQAESSDFTPGSPTPVPAALPLFATGIGALGLLGWRRKRKVQT